MAAGLGFKTFTTGEVLTAGDVNGYLMQGVLVFASEAARNSAITSPQEGQFAYTKDNNSLWYYTGSAWAASGATGDIEGVTAGVGITGGGTSGTVTITNDMATTITASGDIVVGTGSGTYDNLPIGTTAQVLTADTTVSPYKVKWATPSAAMPVYTLAASGSLTGASVSVTGLSGTDFIVELANATPNATVSFQTTYNADTTAGRYYRNDSNASGSALFTRSLGSGTGYYMGFKVNGGNGAATVQTGDTNLGGGLYNQTTAITSIQLGLSSGAWSAGTYKVYQR